MRRWSASIVPRVFLSHARATHIVPYTKARHPTMPTKTWTLKRSLARPKSLAGPRSSTSCNIVSARVGE